VGLSSTPAQERFASLARMLSFILIEMAGEQRCSDHIDLTKFWGESQDSNSIGFVPRWVGES
jgi:hypothetical protein